MRYWLMKSEVTAYSIHDLRRDGRTLWSDVRNYEARNFMRLMRIGDLAFFYHSNAEPSGIAGLMRVCATAAPDPTQFDQTDVHFEPRATRERPVWECVAVEFVAEAERFVSLAALRAQKKLGAMAILQKGSRLSITRVTPAEFRRIAKLAGLPTSVAK